jgi:hypothetical protein
LRWRWFVDVPTGNQSLAGRVGRPARIGILLCAARGDGVDEAPTQRGCGLLVG